jgi:hypothetical protein
MMVVPHLKKAKHVFADSPDRCLGTSTDNGWVDGGA